MVDGLDIKGLTGTIKYKYSSRYAVEFDENIFKKYNHGHSCDEHCKDNYGWNCDADCLEELGSSSWDID